MFSPLHDWDVTVDIDAMERAKGPQHKPDKKDRVQHAEKALLELGTRIGVHPRYGRTDVVACHPDHGVFLIEVEGKSSRQKEQSLYSALGQTVLMMVENSDNITYALAVPDQREWEKQILKIPVRIKQILRLKCFLVSKGDVREV